jgi:hypothetical protein
MQPAAWIDWVSSGPVEDDWRERVDPPQAERLYLERLTARAAKPLYAGVTSLRIEALRHEGSFPHTTLIVEFRAPRRYGDAQFGVRWPLWDNPDAWDESIFWANLVELVEADDTELRPHSGRTWVN